MRAGLLISLLLAVAISALLVVQPWGGNDATSNDNQTVESLFNATPSSDETGLSRQLRTIAVSRDERRLLDIRSIMAALTQYREEHDGSYPAALDALSPDYLGTVPTDPETLTPYAYTPDGEGSYTIVFTFEVGVEGLAVGSHTATPSGVGTP